jgi:F0F1-type ATP synthase membrane subunit b/b'
MSPTLLEFAVAIILIVVAWQIGVVIAPMILRWLRSLKRDVDEAAEEVSRDLDQNALKHQHKEEHTNGTRR